MVKFPGWVCSPDSDVTISRNLRLISRFGIHIRSLADSDFGFGVLFLYDGPNSILELVRVLRVVVGRPRDLLQLRIQAQ